MQATDDQAAFPSAAASGRALDATPRTSACDGRAIELPRGTAGTWIRVTPSDSSIRLRSGPALAPLPVRSVVYLAPTALAPFSCIGGGYITITSVVDAPPLR
jgi:hypothetical protein